MSHPKSLLMLLPRVALLAIGTVAAVNCVAHAGDDAAWLKSGTLLFEDSFDREEDGNLAKAIGNGWNSATANRVPDEKQANLDGGVLKVMSSAKAGHQAHIHHDAGFEDGGAIVRFKLPGLSKNESLTVGFVDRETSKALAGHLCYAVLSDNPPQVQLLDRKTGYSDPDVSKRRQPYLKSGEKLPDDLQQLLDSKMKFVSWKADHEWHELVLVTEGDEMRVTLDGKPLGSHRSEGFAHPMKRWFSLLMNPSAWIDDVKVYKVR
ncbi:MAG: hypothetical protein EBS56_00555 [Planctomycetia bacterium]|nr:hypothetical protein [Planctomycetia bacterium]